MTTAAAATTTTTTTNNNNNNNYITPKGITENIHTKLIQFKKLECLTGKINQPSPFSSKIISNVAVAVISL
jgi:hypothetical protein